MQIISLETIGVSQIAYFWTKRLVCRVRKCGKCAHAEKYVQMQCTVHALKLVQKLSVEPYKLHTLNDCYISDIAEVPLWP